MRITRNEALERKHCEECCAHSKGRYLACTAMPLGGKYCPRVKTGKVGNVNFYPRDPRTNKPKGKVGDVEMWDEITPKSGAQRPGSSCTITPKVEVTQCSLKQVSIFRG